MGTGSSGKQEKQSYSSFSWGFRLGGSSRESNEEKKQRRETVTRFMQNAKAGQTYQTGGGIGSGGGTFEVVDYNRSPNKLGLRYEGMRPVAMSRANVEKYIAGGATLMKRGRRRR